MKILVVDDSPTIRAALKGFVQRMGHTVAEAQNGEEALQLYKREQPDLVLIDVIMPVMDGYEAARRMREASPDEWVPIIFLSSKRAAPNRDHAQQAAGNFARSGLGQPGAREALPAGRADRDRQPALFRQLPADRGAPRRAQQAAAVAHSRLQQVAEALRAAGRRPADLAARYGGEEFALILPGTGLEGAVDVARAVSRAIAGLAIAHARSAVGQNLTLSLGIASLTPEKETSSEDLIHRADQALYQAKQQGRNRYVVFGGK